MTELEIFNAVSEAVNDYDPEQLLGMGCPRDEYSGEINDIDAAIKQVMGIGLRAKVPNEDQLWIIVCNVLHRHFGSPDEPVLYSPRHKILAQSIHQKLAPKDSPEGKT